MPTTYNKLVRDGIPSIIRQDGKTPHTHIANGDELEKALLEKLLEEANEFQSSNDPAELADIQEVVSALASYYGITPQELEAKRRHKADERGTFSQGIILEYVD